ncbi:MAG TPA: AAA family ATPase [Acidimicrobiia bacterium]|nr:AAA family ATPase [Acidimicrobiia bacterium]
MSTPDTTVDGQRAALRAWVQRRRPGREISFTETHVSILAFAGDRAWKLKKAVVYPFVDLSTRKLRRRQCEREVGLNRRLARDVYLGVVPLDDPSGRVVDHLVEMVRMPDDRRLAALVSGPSDPTPCLDRVADVVARFHHGAPSGGAIDAHAMHDAVAGRWEHNLAELAPHVPSILDRDDVDRLAALARAYIAGRVQLFDERVAAGRARDGHGDLLADDIFCLADAPRVLDCLEFDDHLRYGDVLADVAFLAMDLERLGRADLAHHFLDRYRERAGDAWPESLEHFYIAYRALVRAKVACLRTKDGAPETADRARDLLALAEAHLAAGRVRLVLVGGAPGTGKTTLARAVAYELRWPVFHSDEVRKELAGIAPSAHGRSAVDAGIYTPEWDARTYEELCRRAAEHLRRGVSVVLDASWGEPVLRANAARCGASTSSEVISFRCSVAPTVAAARASARALVGKDASDVSGDLARKIGARFVDWPGASVVDTSAAPEVVAASVLADLRGRSPA